MSDSYEERRDRRREEERRYQSDVAYEVWRNGGNMDRVDPDRVYDAYANGLSEESAVRRELRAQRPKQQEPECPECEEET